MRENGKVNIALEACLGLQIVGGGIFEVQVDTGFNGWLTLPQSVVTEIGLPIIGRVESFLAGQTEPQETDVASAQIKWLGEVRRVDVIVLDDYLIGTALLEGTQLTIDYAAQTVLIKSAL